MPCALASQVLEVQVMHAGVRKAAVVLVAFLLGSGLAVGQADSGTQLAKAIREGQSAVSSAGGRRDGVAWLQLAILYQDAALYDDAEGAFRKATDLLKTQDRSRYADALDRMGAMYVERGKFGKATPMEQKALAIRQESNDEAGVGRSYMHLSLLAFGKRDLPGAEVDAEMAVSLLDPQHSDTRTERATPEEKMSALIDLALIRCARGACDAATHDLERALHIAITNYDSNSMPVGFLHFLLGYAQTKSGDAQGGAALMKSGIDEMKTQMGWGHPTYVAALKEYRAVLVETGRDQEAGEVGESIAKLEQSLTIHGARDIGLFGFDSQR